MQNELLRDLVLQNDRVTLTPLLPEHYSVLEPVALQDVTMLRFSPMQVGSPLLLKQYINQAQADREAGTRYAFVVFDRQKNAYAGSTSFGSISWHDKRIEIGWTWIGNDFRQSGLNRHMKFLMMRFVFEQLMFERLELRTDERNLASRTAMVKIGFRFEGILRSHMQMPDGVRRNTAYYSLLRHEWPAVKSGIFKPFE